MAFMERLIRELLRPYRWTLTVGTGEKCGYAAAENRVPQNGEVMPWMGSLIWEERKAGVVPIHHL
jgi:hypothetical protein